MMAVSIISRTIFVMNGLALLVATIDVLGNCQGRRCNWFCICDDRHVPKVKRQQQEKLLLRICSLQYHLRRGCSGAVSNHDDGAMVMRRQSRGDCRAKAQHYPLELPNACRNVFEPHATWLRLSIDRYRGCRLRGNAVNLGGTNRL